MDSRINKTCVLLDSSGDCIHGIVCSLSVGKWESLALYWGTHLNMLCHNSPLFVFLNVPPIDNIK